MRGEVSFNFGDERLNSRNPFAPVRAPFQLRRYGGNLSGPLSAKRASFFIDFERREVSDNSTIRAIVLDPSFNIVPLSQVVQSPSRRTTISPRLDYQLNENNTFVARYTYTRSTAQNAGVGDFNLLSRAYDTSNQEHTLQLTETALINQKIINETRFQYIRRQSDQMSQNSCRNHPGIGTLHRRRIAGWFFFQSRRALRVTKLYLVERGVAFAESRDTNPRRQHRRCVATKFLGYLYIFRGPGASARRQSTRSSLIQRPDFH